MMVQKSLRLGREFFFSVREIIGICAREKSKSLLNGLLSDL